MSAPAHPDGGAFAVRARGLRKRYGELVVLHGLDLDLARGTCLGLLGPNGAGKSTTIEILEGLKAADAGTVEVFGMGWATDGARIRERIGVQLQETEFQDKLTAFEVLRLFRSFYRRGADPEEVLGQVGLREKRDARVSALSGGQRQRLAVGCALLNDPDLLFLDEPTTGLDPQARRRVWEIVEGFKGRGGTVLLTTHYMEEAHRLADDLLIIDHGRILAQGTPDEILATLGAESFVEFDAAAGEGPELEHLEALAGVLRADRAGATVRLSVSHARTAIGALFELYASQGRELGDLRTHRPTLEDVFVHLTGKHLRDG